MRNLFALVLSLPFFSAHSQSPPPGCPSIDLGPDTTINCNISCLDLNASTLNVGLTNTYSISSVSYAPPYPFNQGTSTIVGTDDVWGNVISLPFNFCFFGNTYNQIVVGANGLISFDVTLANSNCAWEFSSSIPSPSNLTNTPFGGTPTQNGIYNNSINGAYHDIDPSAGGSIKYAILGNYPCRTFVVNYYNIPQYGCTQDRTTQQIVLYETTNIIEIYIQDKPICGGFFPWNDDNAVIGIQNDNGTIGFSPNGRNTNNSAWTASNEAWRFTPDGNSISTIDWFDAAGTLIGSGSTITVCPTSTTTYSSNVTYNRCDGTQVVETDQITVNVSGVLPSVIANTNSTIICNGDPVTLTGSGALTYTWNNGVVDGVPFFPTSTNMYIVTGTDINGCINTDTISIIVNNATTSTTSLTSCVPVSWNGVTYSASGTYSYLTSNANGCDSTAFLNLTVNSSSSSTSNETSCDSYIWNGVTYTSSGTYTYFSTNSVGCDSTAILNLIILPITTSNTDSVACSAGGIIWNGQTYTSTGTYIYQTVGSNGCDSIATLNFIFSPTSVSAIDVSSCYPYLWNGITYDTSGTYTYLTNSSVGCDSLITLNLTINSESVSIDSVTACDDYIWNGNVFNISNNYTYLTINSYGCDSVANLVLDIIQDNLFLPNTFTPNNDGLNERFGRNNHELKDYQIWIFNQWGEKIFYSNKSKEGWDGKYKNKVSGDGVYAFRIIYSCANELRERIGMVTILK